GYRSSPRCSAIARNHTPYGNCSHSARYLPGRWPPIVAGASILAVVLRQVSPLKLALADPRHRRLRRLLRRVMVTNPPVPPPAGLKIPEPANKTNPPPIFLNPRHSPPPHSLRRAPPRHFRMPKTPQTRHKPVRN